jgi:chemotaxis protein CheX
MGRVLTRPAKKRPRRPSVGAAAQLENPVTTTANTSGSVQLGEVLDLNAAAPLAAELLAGRGADLDVDASQTRRLGAQAVQVLLSARRTWREDGARLAVVNASAAFRDGLKLLGIDEDALMDKEQAQ